MKKTGRTLIALLAAFAVVFGFAGTANAVEITDAVSEQELEEAYNEGFNELFTNIIRQDENGTWHIVEGFTANYPDMSEEQAQEVATAMNRIEQDTSSPSSHSLFRSRNSPKDFGMCVLKGLIPGAGLVSINWNNVALWIRQKSWGKLSKYLAKHATKVAAKDLAKLTPWGLASSIPISAANCVIWGY